MAPLLTVLFTLFLAGLLLWLVFQVVTLRENNTRLERRLSALERDSFGRQASPAATAVPPVIPAHPTFASLPGTEAERTPPQLRAPAVPRPTVNWEHFTGAKLLAWIGGVAAFLGAAFFVKYSFEHDLIPPAMRVAIGYVFSLALIGGGLRVPRPRYTVTAQTLCATGIVCLYAVTFACTSIYRFEWFGPITTFATMAVITAGAFVIAVRLGAQVVAVLGLLGGFLTPALLDAHRDNPVGLFGYAALLDVGLIALALHQRWQFLVPLGAAGTIATELIWAARFVGPDNITTAMAVCLVFCGLFLITHVAANRWTATAAGDDPRATQTTVAGVGSEFLGSAIALAVTAFLFALWLLRFRTATLEPDTLFAFAGGIALGLLAIPALARDTAAARWSSWAPAIAVLGVAAVEYAWHGRYFAPQRGTTALGWYVVFYIVFAVHPFVFWRKFSGATGPWAIAALAGVVQFLAVYWTFLRLWPESPRAWVPALFAVIPLVSFFILQRGVFRAAPAEARRNQLAWLGGVALFFLTLIIPVQLRRQWITIGWALEGVALLWFFRRLPHPGLRLAAVALLSAAFVRLALNPAVLEYHARSDVAVFNWYLYTYGVVTLCLFVGARLLARMDSAAMLFARTLVALGTVLAFLLLNIEIADFFSVPGTRVLTFQFSGNLARDMSYTIGWAVFAFGLLLISMWQRAPAGRSGALALFAVTVAKLFLHDLAHLSALHRIGALFAVAVIAIGASVAYQRFLGTQEADQQVNR